MKKYLNPQMRVLVIASRLLLNSNNIQMHVNPNEEGEDDVVL